MLNDGIQIDLSRIRKRMTRCEKKVEIVVDNNGDKEK